MAFAALALHLLFAQTQIDLRPSVYAYVDSLTQYYFKEFRIGWYQGERNWPMGGEAYAGPFSTENQRAILFHCHYDGFDHNDRFREPYIIKSHPISHAQCPHWYPEDEKPVPDERKWIDYGLAPAARPRIFAIRNMVRRKAEIGALALPGDLGMAKRLVKLAHDARATRDEWEAAFACTEDEVQCGLLRGFALYDGGTLDLADSVFMDASRAMSDKQRCEWDDVGYLLDVPLKLRYDKMTCDERAQFEERMWWLADPMWSERGNERRAEQFARKELWELLTIYKTDGRQHFEPKLGGSSVREALLRYGWPTHFYWAGPTHDWGHTNWLMNTLSPMHVASPMATPYYLREFSRGRLHTIPDEKLLDDPFNSGPDDWVLDPSDKRWAWWPVEHFAREKGTIVQFEHWQTGMLLRDTTTRYVWAADLMPKRMNRFPGEQVSVTLMVALDVGTVDSVAVASARVGETMVVDAPLSSGQRIMSYELTGDTVQPSMRLRYGEYIAPPLRELGAKHALSQPILYDPIDAPATLHADEAVKRMYGSTSLRPVLQTGVYWEGYGFTADETIEVSMRIVREDKSSKDPVAANWQEDSHAIRAIQVKEGTTPVQMRSVVLDISQLESGGKYRLTVSMKQGDAVAVSERRFQVR